MSGLDDDLGSPQPTKPESLDDKGYDSHGREVQLLDKEGAITAELEACLKHIFAKYCTPGPTSWSKGSGPEENASLMTPPPNARLTSEGLDAWARDTNGAPFSQETKEELVEFLDVTDTGELTLQGFLQIYQLQTENDEAETWRDLSSHGFDRNLRLVTSRREDAEFDEEETKKVAPTTHDSETRIYSAQ